MDSVRLNMHNSKKSMQLLSGLTFLGAMLLAGTAGAQDSTRPTVDVQLFRPTAGANNLITVETGLINRHLEVSGSIFINYANRPLAVRIVRTDGSDDDVGSIVGYRIQADVQAAIGLFGIGELGISIPYLLQGGFDNAAFEDSPVPIDVGTTSLEDAIHGDIRLLPKVQVYNTGDDSFAVAVMSTVVIPTGDGDYARELDFVVSPALALSFKPIDRLTIATDVGYRLRKRTKVQTLIVDDEIFMKAGASFNLATEQQPLELIGEVFGHTPAQNPFAVNSEGIRADFQAARTSFEGNASVRWYPTKHWSISGGLGTGFSSGYGSPVPRFFAGVAYYTARRGPSDIDLDGVPDVVDQCPEKKEDIDEFEDEDGCPDIDNDQDGVLDEDDQCPIDHEGPPDGFNDRDGCPDPDNDEDGLLDEVDQCPNDAEDIDQFEDENGCPDLDNDGDQVADTVDQCPLEVEDIDSFQDSDGCPDPDNDGDGLKDLNDLCPNYPEDMDGVADDDGCPEDNDGDGIADKDDKCPNKAETYNGIKDEDGCPEKLKTKSLVSVTDDKIEIKKKVFFNTGSAVIQKRSYPVLDQIYSVLSNFKHIKKLRIEGHTDSQGSRSGNVSLSQRRAEAVATYLTDKGILPTRLEAAGIGPDKPIASNRSRRGREQNRRVEFIIADLQPIGESVAEPEDPEIELDLPGGDAPPPPPDAAPLFEMEIDGGNKKPKGNKGKGKKSKKEDMPADDGAEIEFEF